MYVQADTVVRWQRERFRRFWARLSKRRGCGRGRRGTAIELRRFIERVAAANPLWRAARIHGELKCSASPSRSQVVLGHSCVAPTEGEMRCVVGQPPSTPGSLTSRPDAHHLRCDLRGHCRPVALLGGGEPFEQLQHPNRIDFLVLTTSQFFEGVVKFSNRPILYYRNEGAREAVLW